MDDCCSIDMVADTFTYILLNDHQTTSLHVFIQSCQTRLLQKRTRA